MTTYLLYTYGPLASYCDVRSKDDRHVGTFMVDRRSPTVRVTAKGSTKLDQALARAINRKKLDRTQMSQFSVVVEG